MHLPSDRSRFVRTRLPFVTSRSRVYAEPVVESVLLEILYAVSARIYSFTVSAQCTDIRITIDEKHTDRKPIGTMEKQVKLLPNLAEFAKLI